MPDVRIKRAYDEASEADGARLLVDRIWPRGVAKKDLELTAWLKDIAPSTSLRKWFGHDPDRWQEFLSRYASELDRNDKALAELLDHVGSGRVTLVYGAKDTAHNNAVALKAYVDKRRSG